MDDLAFRVTELERRVANMIRWGAIADLDETGARATVTVGKLTTAPLKWLTERAGPDSDWWAPEPGEQVIVLSPSGDPAQGVILPAVYQDDYPAPASAKTVRRVQFADGGSAQYDRASGTLTIDAKGPAHVMAGGDATVTAEGKVTVTGKKTVEIIGADGATPKGTVQGDCICAFTGMPHPMISSTVKETP